MNHHERKEHAVTVVLGIRRTDATAIAALAEFEADNTEKEFTRRKLASTNKAMKVINEAMNAINEAMKAMNEVMEAIKGAVKAMNEAMNAAQEGQEEPG